MKEWKLSIFYNVILFEMNKQKLFILIVICSLFTVGASIEDQINKAISDELGFTNNVVVTKIFSTTKTNYVQISEIDPGDQVVLVVSFPMSFADTNIIDNFAGYI